MKIIKKKMDWYEYSDIFVNVGNFAPTKDQADDKNGFLQISQVNIKNLLMIYIQKHLNIHIITQILQKSLNC